MGRRASGRLATFCMPLLGKARIDEASWASSGDTPFRVRIGITVASKDRTKDADAVLRRSARNKYDAPRIAAETEHEQHASNAANGRGRVDGGRNVWTEFPLWALAAGYRAETIAQAMEKAQSAVLLARQSLLELSGLVAVDGSGVAIPRGAVAAVSTMRQSQFESLLALFRIGASVRENGSFYEDDDGLSEARPESLTVSLHRLFSRSFIGSRRNV